MSHAIFHGTVVIKSYKPKPPWSTGFLIHHQRRIKHCSELFKVFFELFFYDVLTNSADEDFRRLVLFITGNRSFRINLNILACGGIIKTYDFTVEDVFLDHDGIDTLRIFEGEEPESTGSPSLVFTHDGTLCNLSELFKVCSQRVLHEVSSYLTDKSKNETKER
jgi:hypothetical protein